MPDYPESDKLDQIRIERTGIIDFLDWLADQGIRLCEVPPIYDHTYVPTMKGTDALIMEWAGVSPIRLEEERRDMIDRLRQAP